MGNRALIIGKDSTVGVYMHWNGGMDTVKPLLDYCSMIAPRAGLGKKHYDAGLPTLMTVMCNFFGNDGSSIYIESVNSADDVDGAYDNGAYIVDGWKIVERKHPYDGFQEQNTYDHQEMLESLDAAQPQHNQIADIVRATLTDPEDIKVGDVIVSRKIYQASTDPEALEKSTVIGFGDGRTVNGLNTEGVPFTDQYADGLGENNVNSYITEPVYVLPKEEEEEYKGGK